MLSALPVDPKRFRLSTLVSMGDRARHELALRAAGTVTSCKLTLGRCLLAIQETRDYRNHGCSGSTHYAMSKLGVSKKEANEGKRVAREQALIYGSVAGEDASLLDPDQNNYADGCSQRRAKEIQAMFDLV